MGGGEGIKLPWTETKIRLKSWDMPGLKFNNKWLKDKTLTSNLRLRDLDSRLLNSFDQSIFWILQAFSILSILSLCFLINLAKIPTFAQKNAKLSIQIKKNVLFPKNDKKKLKIWNFCFLSSTRIIMKWGSGGGVKIYEW